MKNCNIRDSVAAILNLDTERIDIDGKIQDGYIPFYANKISTKLGDTKYIPSKDKLQEELFKQYIKNMLFKQVYIFKNDMNDVVNDLKSLHFMNLLEYVKDNGVRFEQYVAQQTFDNNSLITESVISDITSYINDPVAYKNGNNNKIELLNNNTGNYGYYALIIDFLNSLAENDLRTTFNTYSDNSSDNTSIYDSLNIVQKIDSIIQLYFSDNFDINPQFANLIESKFNKSHIKYTVKGQKNSGKFFKNDDDQQSYEFETSQTLKVLASIIPIRLNASSIHNAKQAQSIKGVRTTTKGSISSDLVYMSDTVLKAVLYDFNVYLNDNSSQPLSKKLIDLLTIDDKFTKYLASRSNNLTITLAAKALKEFVNDNIFNTDPNAPINKLQDSSITDLFNILSYNMNSIIMTEYVTYYLSSNGDKTGIKSIKTRSMLDVDSNLLVQQFKARVTNRVDNDVIDSNDLATIISKVFDRRLTEEQKTIISEEFENSQSLINNLLKLYNKRDKNVTISNDIVKIFNILDGVFIVPSMNYVNEEGNIIPTLRGRTLMSTLSFSELGSDNVNMSVQIKSDVNFTQDGEMKSINSIDLSAGDNIFLDLMTFRNFNSSSTNDLKSSLYIQPVNYSDKSTAYVLKVDKKFTADRAKQLLIEEKLKYQDNTNKNIILTWGKIFGQRLNLADLNNQLNAIVSNSKNDLFDKLYKLQKGKNVELTIGLHYVIQSFKDSNGNTKYRLALNPLQQHISDTVSDNYLSTSFDYFKADLQRFGFVLNDDGSLSYNGQTFKNHELEILFYNHAYYSQLFLQNTVQFEHLYDENYKDVYDDSGRLNVNKLRTNLNNNYVKMCKRMNILTANVSPYLQNIQSGPSDKLKIAIFEDEWGDISSYDGSTSSIELLNGGGFIHPLSARLLEASLAGSNVKGTQKNFIAHLGDHFAMQGKMSSNVLTNSKMRMMGEFDDNNLSFGQRLMKKMSIDNLPNDFLNKYKVLKNGKIRTSNIYTDFCSNLSDLSVKQLQIKGRHIQSTDSNIIPSATYNIASIDHSSTGVTITYKSDKSVVTISHDIKSVYDLWLTLGGEFSMTDGEYSEGNIDFIYHIATNYSELTGRQKSILSLSPRIKTSVIDFVVPHSAVKHGATNLNSTNSFLKTDSPFGFMTIPIKNSGIQSDPQHEAAFSMMSAPTQVISAAATGGYEWKYAENVFNGVAKNITDSFARQFRELSEMDTADLAEADKKLLNKYIVKIFKTAKNISTGNDIAAYFREQVLKDSKNPKIIPFSDHNIFGLFANKFLSKLNQDIIRNKVAGLAVILNPSQNVIKIFDHYDINSNNEEGLTLKDVESGKAKIYKRQLTLRDVDKLRDAELLSVQQVNGFKQHIIELIESDRDQFLWLTEDYIEAMTDADTINEAEITFDYSRIAGELQTKSDIFKSILDLNQEHFTYLLRLSLKLGETIYQVAYDLQLHRNSNNLTNKLLLGYREIASDDLEMLDWIMVGDKEVYLDTPNKLATYFNTGITYKKLYYKSRNLKPKEIKFKINGKKYNLWSYGEVGTIGSPNPPANLKIYLQELYKLLASGQAYHPDYRLGSQVNDDGTFVSTSGEILPLIVAIDSGSLNVKNDEIILPKTLTKQFNLGSSTLYDINKKGYNFFIDKIAIVPPKKDGIVIHTNDGVINIVVDHANKVKGNSQVISESVSDNYTSHQYILHGGLRIVDEKLKDIDYDGTTFTINAKDAVEYLTNILNFLKPSIYFVNGDKSLSNITNSPTSTKKNTLKKSTTLRDLLVDYNVSVLVDDKSSDAMFDGAVYRTHLGKDQFNSYKQQLEVLSARIPAQALQSFMAMTTVAHTEEDTSDGYVSIWQILLQGSDFDIDKAFTSMYALNKTGRFDSWSPLFDFNNLNKSKRLPLPNNNTVETTELGGIEITESDLTRNNLLDTALAYFENKQAINISTEHGKRFANLIRQHERFTTSEESVENYILYNQLQVIKSLKSLYASHTGIDTPVQELKSLKAKKTKKTDPSFSTSSLSAVYKMQEVNRVGKSTVGVAANAQKGLMIITQFYNKKVNDVMNSDTITKFNEASKESVKAANDLILDNLQVKRLTLNIPSDDGRDIEPFRISGICDLNYDVINRFIENEEDKLTNNFTDGANTISGLISLAVDNAKELALYDLLAYNSYMGMYGYLVVAGVTPRQIVNLMTSKEMLFAANIVSQSFFTNDTKSIRSVLNTIDYYFKHSKSTKPDIQNRITAIRNQYPGIDNLKIPVVKTLQEVLSGAEELRFLNSFLSLNQGVSGRFDEFIGKINQLEEIVKTTTKTETFNSKEFTLNKFLNDSKYQELAIAHMEGQKHSFNILDVIKNTPHFYNLLKVSVGVNDIFKQIKSINFTNKIKDNIELITKDRQQFKKRKGFVVFDKNVSIAAKNMYDKLLIFNFLKKQNISYSGNTVNANLETVTISGDFNSIGGINEFQNYFVNVLFPKLQNSDEFNNNELIKNLVVRRVGLKNNTFTKQVVPKINMNNLLEPLTAIEIDKYVNGLKELDTKTIKLDESSTKEYKITDLIYYYYLITSFNRIGKYSLNPIFKSYINNPDFKVNSFIEYESQIEQLSDISLTIDTDENSKSTFDLSDNGVITISQNLAYNEILYDESVKVYNNDEFDDELFDESDELMGGFKTYLEVYNTFINYETPNDVKIKNKFKTLFNILYINQKC